MKSKKLYLKKWWAPPVTHFIAFPLFVVLTPYLLHKIHHWHNLTLTIMVFMALLCLLWLAKIHNYSLKKVLFIEVLFVIFTFFTWPKEPMGNWNLQRADHLILWAFTAYVAVVILEMLHLFKEKNERQT